MKTSLICILALVLGLQVAAGLSLLKRIKNAKSHKRQAFALPEVMVNEIKDSMKMGLDGFDSLCPDNGELPDCSAVESDIDEMMESVYTHQGALEEIADEVEAKGNGIKETLKSQGLSRPQTSCTMYSCVLMNMYERSTNNETIQACDVNKCVFKRGLDLRNLKHLQNQLHYRGLDKSANWEENNVGDKTGSWGKNKAGDKTGSWGKNKAGDKTGSWESNGSNEDEEASWEEVETGMDLLQLMCFMEDTVANCEDKDNDECATILTNDMIATIQQCFAEGSIKKKGTKETIVDKLKRMVAEKEAEVHRERVLKRLLGELNL